MNLIAAVDKNWGLGKNNDLLYHLPEDLKYFKSVTMGKSVILGDRTLFSFPNAKPLPGRHHYVLTFWDDLHDTDQITILKSMDELYEAIKDVPKDDIFVIGGASIYKQLYKKCKKLYLTKILSDEIEPDVYFPNIDEDEDFELIEPGEILTSKNGLKYRFTIYENKTL